MEHLQVQTTPLPQIHQEELSESVSKINCSPHFEWKTISANLLAQNKTATIKIGGSEAMNILS
jgi:hypothetical protein